jgi:myo-inositol catabolism protein IolC
MDWKDKKISRDAAVSEISDRFRQWVDIFEQARQRRTAA